MQYITIFFLFSIMLLGFGTYRIPENKTEWLLSKDYTDVLRAWAIIMVISMHIIPSVVKFPNIFDGPTLFLILSGYGLAASWDRSGRKSYWKKRIKGTILPYMIFIATYRLLTGSIDDLGFALDFLCLHTSFWFIDFIVYNYIIFYLINILEFNRAAIVATYLAFAVAICFWGDALRQFHLLDFPIGILVFKNKDYIKHAVSTFNFKVLIAVSLCAGLVLYFGQAKTVVADIPLLTAIVKSIAKPAIILPMMCIPFYANTRFLTGGGYLANLTLYIYLIHLGIINYVIDPQSPVTSGILFCVCSFGGAWLFHICYTRLSALVPKHNQ